MLFHCGKKWSCLQKKAFSLTGKNNVWRSFSEPVEILFTFFKIFGESNAEKKGEGTGRRGSIVKVGKSSLWKRGLWKSCGTLLVWGSYGNNLNRFGWILKYYRNALCLHRVDQLVRSAKKEMLFYLSEPGISHMLNDIII